VSLHSSSLFDPAPYLTPSCHLCAVAVLVLPLLARTKGGSGKKHRPSRRVVEVDACGLATAATAARKRKRQRQRQRQAAARRGEERREGKEEEKKQSGAMEPRMLPDGAAIEQSPCAAAVTSGGHVPT
jgi:hypothetical protein